MIGSKKVPTGVRLLGLSVIVFALSGCTYDYFQRSDRIAYSAGNAVKANLARETTNPTSGTMYDTDGLGGNGVVADPPKP